jgi:predicted RNase H-like HicB family nuclease
MNDKWIEQAKELAMRPYFVKIVRDETTDGEPIYLAHVLELEGCFGQGENPEAAVADLKLAMIDYIASLLEDNLPIPNPADFAITTSSTSGKTVTVSMTNQASDQTQDTPKTPSKLTDPTLDQTIVFNPQSNIIVPAV